MDTITTISAAWSFMMICGIIGFISFVLLIVGLAMQHKKLWKGSLFGLIISLVAFVGLAVFSIFTAADKINELAQESRLQRLEADAAEEEMAIPKNPDERLEVLNPDNRTPMMNNVMEWEPNVNPATVPTDYYTYFGHEDWYRLPVLYPYAIGCDIDLDNGRLYNETGVEDFADAWRGDVPLHYDGIIERLCFDKSIILLEGRPYDGSNTIEFMRMGVYSGEITKYETEGRLRQAAKKAGFDPLQKEYLVEIPWMTIREYSDAL